MDILHSGVGNLGAEPELKTVKVNGEDRKVVEMRVFLIEAAKPIMALKTMAASGVMWPSGMKVWGNVRSSS